MDTGVIIHQMLILFIIMATGYLLNKVHILGPHIDGGITRFIIYCTMPATILASVVSREGNNDVRLALLCIIAAACMYIILPIIAWILARLMRVPKHIRGIYQFMMIFGNVGFMGFPIIVDVFGEEYLVYCSIFNIFFNLLAFSYGVYLIAGDEVEGKSGKEDYKFSWKSLLTPGISGAVLALVLYFLNVSFPDVIAGPIESIGSITSPLAMLIIGSTLANMDLREAFNDIRVYILIAVRFVLLPLAIFPLLKLVIPDEFVLQLTMFMLVMPVGNMSVLYAKEYGSDESLAAKSIFISTLLSIVTVPLMVYVCF
ncbi:MAG: AEC family transporter [Lachnospiraceae bacterium]|nr:AEC family transporter [Lachnospiraceae bacterium]